MAILSIKFSGLIKLIPYTPCISVINFPEIHNQHYDRNHNLGSFDRADGGLGWSLKSY